MKIAVSGASGFVGSKLVPMLRERGHEVIRLVRSKDELEHDTVWWRSQNGSVDAARLDALDAMIHLAGENLAGGRWTKERKARIRNSRVEGTRVLSMELAKLPHPPAVFISASAVGYYGDRGADILTEESSSGQGFLAEVVQEWEAAAAPALAGGIRVVHLRFAMILSGAGGALGKMLRAFRLGVGGVIGDGNQYWSWVAMDDVLEIIELAARDARLAGAINVAAPEAVTNREFTKTLGRVLSRPTVFWMPAFAARLVFGEMADEALLASVRVEPAKLKWFGYQFRYEKLDAALRGLLARE